MKILVTGANGQLGSEIKERQEDFPNWNFLFCDVSELDITNLEAVESFVSKNEISAIVNCAAYTAVDLAETNIECCEAVNVMGAKNLAIVADKNKIKYIHTSTDFVFDGHHYLPYKEKDCPNPMTVYGRTKLQGEQEVLNKCPKSIVIRTAWLYSSYGGNFVKTMQRLGREREQLNVIFDQVGTPTWAGDLAGVILEIIRELEKGGSQKGLYHYSNEGLASWYDFAVEIMELSNLDCKVLPIETKEYPTPAPRPAYSVLNKSKIKNDFGLEIPHWKQSLKKCILAIQKL
ncbi:dTDP-4-dehydrorhamnose reductase [Flavicella sp.]|uniref:dTDP-4-dehydrorhamnose reductase n=1 Tax=Flavicella sp. TaxID=2957742 RepID=UPI003015CA52